MTQLPTHSQSQLHIAQQLLQKDFGEYWPEQFEWADIEELIEGIQKVLRPLLNHQMDKLLTIFYRLDLDESKVRQILSLTEPEILEKSLALLILKREIEKAKWREKYR